MNFYKPQSWTERLPWRSKAQMPWSGQSESVEFDTAGDLPAAYDFPPSEPQIFRGYSDADLRVFNRFARQVFEPHPGFITDVLGVRTRVSFHTGLAAPQGAVMGLPIPNDNMHAETVEWVGLLKSVLSARERFVCMELGAGWGPWIVGGAVAARHLGITDIHLTGVEADPGHFAFMQEHLRDNGLDPGAHNLLQAAVGVKAGRARWPKCADPASEWGSRPTAEAAPSADHLGRVFNTWLDVKVVPFRDLLSEQPVWNLVHIDVQGWEADLCLSAAKLIDQRVRWMVVATHDPKLHGDVMQQMHGRGWRLENEKPPRLKWRDDAPSLQAMVAMDGTQVWRNMRALAVPAREGKQSFFEKKDQKTSVS